MLPASLLAPLPSLWKPELWLPSWWRLPVMETAGKGQRNPANGKGKRKAASGTAGKTPRNTTGTDCCCAPAGPQPCSSAETSCSDYTPQKYLVTFSGVTICSCYTISSTYAFSHPSITAGTLSGSWTVTCNAALFNLYQWAFIEAPPGLGTVTEYASGCTGSPTNTYAAQLYVGMSRDSGFPFSRFDLSMGVVTTPLNFIWFGAQHGAGNPFGNLCGGSYSDTGYSSTACNSSSGNSGHGGTVTWTPV